MFNEYPYVNLQDVNLDWILKHIKELEVNLQDFIKINTVKYANPIDWNISKQYEANTVVVNEFTGVAYLSTKPVPSGVDVTNTDYWTPIFTLDFMNLNKNITLRDDGNNNNATFASVTGDWLIVGGQLYKVIQDIGVHTAYVVGFNIEIYTVELFVKDYLNQVLDTIGNLQELTTSDKTSIVNAINSLVTVIGDLQELTTSNKTSVVNAINSVLSDLNTKIGDLNTKIGDLQELDTTDKTSVVNAINSVHSNLTDLTDEVGDLDDLETTDKTSIVNAVNEAFNNTPSLNALKINPDDYEGTDSQKLQSAYDDAVSYCNTHNQSAVIILDRQYDITGNTIFLHYPDSAKNAHIKFIGLNHGGIYRGGIDSGYMFAEQSGYVGGCKWHDFINIRFSGQGMTRDNRGIVDDTDDDNYDHSRVFNMLHLNNMSVSYCDFNNLSYIYDYSGSVDSTTSGAYTLWSHHNTYYWCTRIIRLGYSQNAINFENEYMALGVNILNATNNLKSFVGVHFRNCTIEYFNGYGFYLADTSAVLYDFAITGCYLEGIRDALVDFRNKIRTLDISNNTMQLAGNISAITGGVGFYHDNDVSAVLRNNYIMRSTAVSGVCLSLTHAPTNGKMIDGTGLLMTDQNNNLINGLQTTISQYLMVGESTAYSNSGTHAYSNAFTEEQLASTTIADGGLYKISFDVEGNAGGVNGVVRVNSTSVLSDARYYASNKSAVSHNEKTVYIPSGATVVLNGVVETPAASARSWSISIKRV